MNTFVKIFCFFTFGVILLFTGCSNYMWTGQSYSGTIDKSDSVDSDGDYYDKWNVGCSGKWTITITSKSNIEINVSIKDIFDNERFFLMTTHDSLTQTFDIPVSFICKVWVDHYLSTWASNNYKADYTISAKLN